jgi:hypothetical protein
MYEPKSCLENEYRAISTSAGSGYSIDVYIEKTNLVKNKESILEILNCLIAEYYKDIVAQDSFLYVTVYKRNFDSFKDIPKEYQFRISIKLNSDSYEIYKIAGSRIDFQKSDYYLRRLVNQNCCKLMQ